MSEQEQPDGRNDDELDLEEVGAELDDLLTEIGSDDESQTDDELLMDDEHSDDALDDGFDELVSLPELDDELDLSSAEESQAAEQVSEVETEAPAVAEPVAESMESEMSGDPLAEVAAIAAERNAEVAKKQLGLGGRTVQLALAGVAAVALLAAVLASWLAFSASAQLDELNVKIAQLQKRESVSVQAADSGDSAALRGDMEKLVAQVTEMAATLDGSLVELRDKSDAALAAVTERLDKLEKAAATVPPPAPVAAVKPLVEKIPTTDSAKPASGGWSVNLISLSNEKVADKELARLRNLGIRAEKQRVEQDGRVWFRLRVPGFTSHDGAKAYIDTVEGKAGVSNAWVGKN